MSLEFETADERPCLLVDEQRVNIQALFQAFRADHKVRMATSGEQALALCRSQPPDLVLLDVAMPGKDGFEVCRELMAGNATQDIPVARCGGGEFGLLLPDTDLDGALHLANQIRQRLLETQIEHADSTIGPLLTISIGVCTLPPGAVGSAATLLREADAQLYLAKFHGRNQACAVVLPAT